MKIKHLWVYIETQWKVTPESHELDNYTLSLKLYRILMQVANPQQIPTLCQEMGRNKGCEWWRPLRESSGWCEEVWAMGTAGSTEDCLNITKDSGTRGMAQSVNVRGLEFDPQSPCKHA